MTVEMASEPASALSPDAKAPEQPTGSNPRCKPIGVSIVVLAFAIALYLGLCFFLLHGEMHATGTVTFPLDDTYITMALAKNFAFQGIWGLGRAGFQSSTSTPGYLLLLAAGYRVFGASEWLPLALSIIFGVCAIVAARQLLVGERAIVQAAALAAIVFFAPLHAIGILGIEHTLQLTLLLVFLGLFSSAYAQERLPGILLLAVTACAVSVRYESLFFVAGAGLLLLLRGRFRASFTLGAAAAVPVAIYGIISVLHGCYWLPHSISLKGISGQAAAHSPIEFVRHFATMMGRAPYLGALLAVMAVLLAIPSIRADLRRRALLAVASGAIVLHLALADVGWVYRYEAYLIGCAIAAIACAVSAINLRLAPQRWAVGAAALAAACGCFLLYQRTADADTTIPLRSLAIYCQQIQMARFLHDFEPGAAVAANDVGAINYFADINGTDLVGLSDKEIFWLKRRGEYTTEAMADLTARRNVKIAVVYDSWFSRIKSPVTSGPPLPSSWIRVQRWATPNGIFLGDGVVSFYATDAEAAADLSRALAQFDATSLPRVDRVLAN